MENFYIEGEDIEGNYYNFESIGTLQEVKRECQELLETLDGGHFDIFDNVTDQFVDCVEW